MLLLLSLLWLLIFFYFFIIINFEIFLIHFQTSRHPLPIYYKFNRSRIVTITKTHNILLSFLSQWPQFPVRRHDHKYHSFPLSPLCGVVRVIFFPMAQQPLVGQGPLMIEGSRSHSDAPHSVGLLWTSDLPDAQTSTCQYKTQETVIYAPVGIRTHNFSKRAPADPRHWDRHLHLYIYIYMKQTIFLGYIVSEIICIYNFCYM